MSGYVPFVLSLVWPVVGWGRVLAQCTCWRLTWGNAAEPLNTTQQADVLMARSVADPEALRTQLIELVTALGGPRGNHQT